MPTTPSAKLVRPPDIHGCHRAHVPGTQPQFFEVFVPSCAKPSQLPRHWPGRPPLARPRFPAETSTRREPLARSARAQTRERQAPALAQDSPRLVQRQPPGRPSACSRSGRCTPSTASSPPDPSARRRGLGARRSRDRASARPACACSTIPARNRSWISLPLVAHPLSGQEARVAGAGRELEDRVRPASGRAVRPTRSAERASVVAQRNSRSPPPIARDPLPVRQRVACGSSSRSIEPRVATPRGEPGRPRPPRPPRRRSPRWPAPRRARRRGVPRRPRTRGTAARDASDAS